MMHHKKEIESGLRQNFLQFTSYVKELNKHQFEEQPEGKWSSGQHLDHLIKSVKPLNKALLIPKFLYPYVFGRLNRTPRKYEDLVKRYNERLASVGKATSRFVPPVIHFDERTYKIDELNTQLNKLCKHLNSLSEKYLDTLLLPHPLLGKLTLREMMFFTAYHTQHHHNILAGRK